MGEDLRKLNFEFQKIMEKIRLNRNVNKETESLCYLFFIAGFNLNSGMTQIIA